MADLKLTGIKKTIKLIINVSCWTVISLISSSVPITHMYAYLRSKAILALNTQQIFKQCIKLFL